jgi:hypothetical protein
MTPLLATWHVRAFRDRMRHPTVLPMCRLPKEGLDYHYMWRPEAQVGWSPATCYRHG